MIFIILLFVLVSVSAGQNYHDNLVEDEPLPDFYAVLKVSHTATLKEIKKSFRKLAMQFHPDKNKDDNAQDIFQELSEAYSILSDEEKKSEYDELYKFDHNNHEDDMSEETNDDILVPKSEAKLEAEEVKPSASKTDGSSEFAKDKESSWGDLDDETLFKVLRFLADNDYEIIKKKIFKDIPVQSNQDRMYHDQSRTKRSSNFGNRAEESERYSRSGYTPGREYRSADGPEVNYSRYYSDPTVRFNSHQQNSYSRYSNPSSLYSNPEPTAYCRTTVSWDGATRVTHRSCY